ncbi:MAG: hypothetical protein P9L92_15190 [Candidatus Electryonea clarkiae]|nr:hypothetical protein [Candidatus Electryonea clarkiae]MDP8287525.1 hypothetical protein [Candidatus Electryonea clarkiae]
MSFDVLQVRSTALKFLGRHQGLSRRTGYSSDNTNAFESAVEDDRKSADIGRFRGVDPYSPFYTRPVGEFRGIDTSSPMFRTPDGEKHDSDPEPRLMEEEHPLYDLYPEIHTRNADEEAVDEVSSSNPYDSVFAREDSEVRDLLTDTDDLNDSYVNDIPSKAQAQEYELAGYAENAIAAGVDKATWESQPDVARLALENRGSLADEIKDSDDFRDLLKESPDAVMLDESRKRVRNELSEKLRNSGDILDEEFMKEHPLAALNLLDRPDLVNWVEQDMDNARAYKRDAGLYDDQTRNRLGSEAAKRVESSPFDEDWFDGNKGVAEAVWADSVTGHDDKVGTWMDSQETIQPEDAFAPELAGQYWSDIAKRESGGEDVIPEHLFDSNESLSMMTSLNGDFAESLQNSAEAITTSFPDFPSTSLTTVAYRGYGLGLADRSYGDYQRIF